MQNVIPGPTTSNPGLTRAAATAGGSLIQPPSRLSDERLLAEVVRLARCEREATVELIAHLAELDARRLHLGLGYSSLFAYCSAVLRLSEHEAYNRIAAARAARRFPVVLERLRAGSVNLSTVRLLSPHLEDSGFESLLESAVGLSKREVEDLLALRFPQPPVPESIRRLPSPSRRDAAPAEVASRVGASSRNPDVATSARPSSAQTSQSTRPESPAIPSVPATPPVRRAEISPLASDQYRITFTASAATREKLRRAQDLPRHRLPAGAVTEVIDLALSALVAQLEKQKAGAAQNPPRRTRPTRPGSRHIPAEIRRQVWARDGGRCAYVAADGTRCVERGFLEFHHLRPFAADGEASVTNVALRCRPHNGHEASVYFGAIRASEGPSSFPAKSSPFRAEANSLLPESSAYHARSSSFRNESPLSKDSG